MTVLIVAVIGSIYAGIATATEAAAVGVLGALVIAGVGGSLTRASVVDSLMGAVRTSCMIGFILMGAAFLTSAMSFTGLPATVAAWITGLGLAPWQLLTVLTAFRVLFRNRMRAGLTMLGIIIGVGAVIAMVSIGQGAKAVVQAQVASMGTNVIIILPGATTTGGVRGGQGSGVNLTVADAQDLKKRVPLVSRLLTRS